MTRKSPRKTRSRAPTDGPQPIHKTAPSPLASHPSAHPDGDKPVYTENRELWARGYLVKQLRVPAEVQEVILLEFERRGWPPWIDDPLPREQGVNPKDHLHEAIKSLNRNQWTPILHFRGDGTGRRIGWEFVTPAGHKKRRR